MIGDIPQGLPPVKLPPFSIAEIRNETTGEIIKAGESFGEMISSLGSGLIVVPLIALLENIAICKAFSNGKAIDASQELIAIGTANIANSFVQGYPGTGALSRGAVNNASGVRTPLGSLYTGKSFQIVQSNGKFIAWSLQAFSSFCPFCSSRLTSFTSQNRHWLESSSLLSFSWWKFESLNQCGEVKRRI